MKTYRRSLDGRAVIVVHSGTKFITPQPGRLTTDVNSPLCRQIFNTAVTTIESERQPHPVLDDIGRKSVTFMRKGACVRLPIVAPRQLTWQYQLSRSNQRSGFIGSAKALPFSTIQKLLK
ncbi:MAG: hypothetical protein ACI8PT_004551 [Gammaproteobacteria bacterium]|jgi:hypothetical protein